ncbi:choice-of-anchor Q domain-containing protein [Chloroflexota bacterium]
MKLQRYSILIGLAFAQGIALVWLWLLMVIPTTVQAQGTDGFAVYYVDAGGGCGGATPCYANLQAAVDTADDPDDVIKVAMGIYSDVNNYAGLAQVVYISKSLTLRGGYTTTNWITSFPLTQPTTLDARGLGRGLFSGGEITVTLEGLQIQGGNADGLGGYWTWFEEWDAGGGIYAITGTIRIKDSLILSNTAYYGGGIHISSGNAVLEQTHIVENYASYGGGAGVYLWKSQANMTDNTIKDNDSIGSGGGLFIDNSVLLFDRNVVSDNHSPYDGSGLMISSSVVTMTHNSIVLNGPATIYANQGGGLFMTGSKASIISNTFSQNHSNGGGGLALNSGYDITLIDNIISANAAGEGGGLYVSGGDVVMVSNTITANIADYGGGAWLIGGPVGEMVLERNLVYSNSAELAGGGLYLLHNSEVLLDSNVIISNSAGSGGGMYVDSKCNAMLVNNIIADNHVIENGSGIEIVNSSGVLLHNTIARNTGGDQSGIFIRGVPYDPSFVVMTNTIVVAHSVGITVGAGSAVSLNNTLWGSGSWENETDWAGMGAILTGTSNLWADPAFINPPAQDYHLTSASAAIDAGVDAGITVDIDGDSRPARVGYDIGADEFPFSVILMPNRSANALPGTVITYTHTLTNNRASHDTFTLSHSSSQGWMVSYDTPIALDAGQATNLMISVTIPGDAISGTLDTTVIIATSQSAPSVFDGISDSTTVTFRKVFLPLIFQSAHTSATSMQLVGPLISGRLSFIGYLPHWLQKVR